MHSASKQTTRKFLLKLFLERGEDCSRRVFSSLLNSRISALELSDPVSVLRIFGWSLRFSEAARLPRVPLAPCRRRRDAYVTRLFGSRAGAGEFSRRGGSRRIRRCSAECTASKSSKAYMRSARVRSSPGVCGPRRSKTRQNGNLVAVKIVVFVEPVLEFGDARIAASGADQRLIRKASAAPGAPPLPQASSPGSRLDFWLQALTSAFKDSG